MKLVSIRSFTIKMFLALVGFSFLFGVYSNTFASDEKENILAQVGSYKLTLEEFESQIQSLPPQLQMALLKNPQMKEQFLDRWVDITLIAQEARDKKLDQDPEIQAKIEDIMNAVLAQEFLRREIEGKVKITDDEIETYYKGHKEEFTSPESVKACHILLKVPEGADEKAWKEAESKAKDIKKKLENGEDFAELAKKYSDDPGSKNKGGDLGFFTKGRMVPEFESAAFSLKPGEMSGPVKTDFGYHIIEVKEKKAASTKALAEVQAQIRQTLQREKQQQLQDELIEKLKAKYPVKVNKDLLTEDKSQESTAPSKK
ncbi:MAG: peptidylprolyl isomerase [Deltaproteobacteria bacterium]|nr:peptidylprolyl isomerase [Deltaproteobacteria bacterium]MDL1962468.1 peptidylprolyl isomerase [Deltaproteobacteria bacterium]